MDREKFDKYLSQFLEGNFPDSEEEDSFLEELCYSDEDYEEFFNTVDMTLSLRANKERLYERFPEFKKEAEEAEVRIAQAAQELVMKANEHEEACRFEEAIKCFREALEWKPGDEAIAEKISELQTKLPLMAEIGHEKKIVEWVQNQVEFLISSAGRVVLKIGETMLLDRVFTMQELRGVVATATKYSDKKPPEKPRELLGETAGFRIELEKGARAGKIIITRTDAQ